MDRFTQEKFVETDRKWIDKFTDRAGWVWNHGKRKHNTDILLIYNFKCGWTRFSQSASRSLTPPNTYYKAHFPTGWRKYKNSFLFIPWVHWGKKRWKKSQLGTSPSSSFITKRMEKRKSSSTLPKKIHSRCSLFNTDWLTYWMNRSQRNVEYTFLEMGFFCAWSLDLSLSLSLLLIKIRSTQSVCRIYYYTHTSLYLFMLFKRALCESYWNFPRENEEANKKVRIV